MLLLLIVFTATPAQPAGNPPAAPPAPADLTPIPYPSLDGLERAVAAQLTEVRRQLEALKTRDAQAALVYGEAGRHYHAYALDAAAEACYRNAETLAPADFRWPYLLGVLYEQTSRLDDAAGAFARALQPPDKYYPAIVRLAAVEFQRGRLEAAAQVLEPARRHAPDDPALLGLLGQLAQVQGRPEDAVRDLGAALAQQPKATRLHYPLGMALRALGRRDEARRHLAAAGSIGVQPRDPVWDGVQALRRGENSFLIEGHEAYRAGDYSAAAAAYARAFEASGSRSTTALVNLAASEVRLERIGSAVARLEQARRLAPDAPNVLFNLGVLLAHAGRTAEAAAALERVVALEPQDHAARLELVLALFAAGRAEPALVALEPLTHVDKERCPALRQALDTAHTFAGDALRARLAAAHQRLHAAGTCLP